MHTHPHVDKRVLSLLYSSSYFCSQNKLISILLWKCIQSVRMGLNIRCALALSFTNFLQLTHGLEHIRWLGIFYGLGVLACNLSTQPWYISLLYSFFFIITLLWTVLFFCAMRFVSGRHGPLLFLNDSMVNMLRNGLYPIVEWWNESLCLVVWSSGFCWLRRT